MLGGLGDIFGMPQPQSYVPPQEVRLQFSNFCSIICLLLICLS